MAVISSTHQHRASMEVQVSQPEIKGLREEMQRLQTQLDLQITGRRNRQRTAAGKMRDAECLARSGRDCESNRAPPALGAVGPRDRVILGVG
ncbi:hypothetical protein EVAR_76024_1 [Eumeta japonica]|uniref:Uncharacterized protein n=1 Tax=Eumeta variegata TaxID=151549 RepID=A0A4C1UAG7_EUMVA|nr:hypothetical protein EVAR_76024_1 [Eumeta japonica]